MPFQARSRGPYIETMTGSARLELELLGGARELLAAHARELPQRDDLCGAFCGALALAAAGLRSDRAGEPLDQDAVALAAGSVISGEREPGTLPRGEAGRRDYRLQIAEIEDSDVSGTTAAGVIEAIAELSEGTLTPLALAGPWNAATLAGLFDAAAALTGPVTLIANLATHHLWGGSARVDELLDHLLDGREQGPAPDWRVGHFACVFGRIRGPRGTLYAVADTYPALGNRGVHLQPQERLAAALERRDMPAGGIIAVVDARAAIGLREAARAAGLREGVWDNGTVTQTGRG
jgi:hypothetical protein